MTENEFEDQVEDMVDQIAEKIQKEIDEYYIWENTSVRVKKSPTLMALIESSVRRDLTT